MVDYTNRNKGSFTQAAATYDEGLRSHMLKVYNHMAMGLGLSGLIAFFVTHTPALAMLLVNQGTQMVLLLAMLAMVFVVMPKMFSMSESSAKLAFYGYAVLLSLSISPIFLFYTAESVARVFFITAGTFLSLSLYGYTTKKDLTSWGTFGMIGVWGVFIASLVNIFMKSSGLSFIASIVAVVASIALTAYDTQKIKQVYYALGRDKVSQGRAAIMGAMQLYFDFVYMFINLLNLLGNRR